VSNGKGQRQTTDSARLGTASGYLTNCAFEVSPHPVQTKVPLASLSIGASQSEQFIGMLPSVWFLLDIQHD